MRCGRPLFFCMDIILEDLDPGHTSRRPASTPGVFQDVPATAIDWEAAGGFSVALTHFLGYALSLFLFCFFLVFFSSIGVSRGFLTLGIRLRQVTWTTRRS